MTFSDFCKTDAADIYDFRKLALHDLRNDERQMPDFKTFYQLKQWVLKSAGVSDMLNEEGLKSVWSDYQVMMANVK